MNNSELTAELVWAFQYVDDRYLDIVEQEKTGQSGRAAWNLGRGLRTIRKSDQKSSSGSGLRRNRGAVVAAACVLCLILILALPVAAIAANWFGLRDLLLPPKAGETTGMGGNKTLTGEDIGTGIGTEIEIDAGQAFPEQNGDDVSGTENRGVISLAGYQGSPEWQALAEWKEFLEGYDRDDTIHQVTGNRMDASFARYSCYMVHSREMADKMDELAGKYDLKLHTASYDLEKYPELLEPCGGFLGQGHGYDGYMYEDGTFQMAGSMKLGTAYMWDFQLLRSVKGIFHDAMLDIGDVADFEEWRYKAACGVTVTLALGPDKALILADLEDCFVTVSVYSIVMPVPAGANEGVTRAALEALADGFDFAALSPVVTPERAGTTGGPSTEGGSGTVLPSDGSSGALPSADGNSGIAPSAGSSPHARKLYAATLRNLLYSRILPNGTYQDLPLSDSSKFAVYDVDGDGREELVLCYDSGYTFGMWGFVIGYDEGSGELHIQMEGQFDLAFLKNGNLKELDSHNQTSGDMWPYSLYRYLPESDSYEKAGHVHAEDKAISEKNYPDEVDVSGTGTVYYVGDGWGKVPVDEADYLAWLTANQGESEELEIPYLAITEENIQALEL